MSDESVYYSRVKAPDRSDAKSCELVRKFTLVCGVCPIIKFCVTNYALVCLYLVTGCVWANSSGEEKLFQFDSTKAPSDYLQPVKGSTLPQGVSIEKDETGGMLAFRETQGLFWFYPGQDVFFSGGGELQVRMRTTSGGSLGVLLGAEKADDPAYLFHLTFNPGKINLILSKTLMSKSADHLKGKLASKSAITDSSGQWCDLKITYVQEKTGGVRISAEMLDAKGMLLAMATAIDTLDPLPPKGRIGLRAWINSKAGPGEIQIQKIVLRSNPTP